MARFSNHRARRANKYPLGTVAYYGPDNTFATKVVAALLERPEQREAEVMRTWTTTSADVRTDPAIAAEVATFLRDQGAKETVTAGRIVGCPHQEGIDYPMGRRCPQCPFWHGIDRFTHEPVAEPTPTMLPSEILAALASDSAVLREEALASADGHREALVAPLLAALNLGIDDPVGASEEEVHLFAYALYLTAKWRERRAYPYVIRWLSLPEDQPFEIGGDIVTQDGARILAAVSDGDLAPIKTLILNRDADPYGRDSAIRALALLAAWAELPRAPIVEYLRWLAREGLEREPGQAWNSLVHACLSIGAFELFDDLRQAFADGLPDPKFISLEELDQAEVAAGATLDRLGDLDFPIDDVAEATAWWDREPDVPEPYRAPPKVGRNDPCPCGSGKKYKKCHGAA